MNCANHSDLPVSAYCQNCGKPLCTQCVRSVAGVVYCEPCLAARLHAPHANPAAAPGPAAATAARSSTWTAVPRPAGVLGQQDPFGRSPSPILAGLLGVIPGVGAMYNGQFIKALAHVLVFVFLIGMTDRFPLAGILIAAWVFYQIFDAIQTAVARRDGLPLPDPFGLNDLGQRLGVPVAGGQVYSAPGMGAAGPASTQPWGPASGPASGEPAPSAGPGSPDWDAWAHRVAAAHAQAATGVPVTGAGEYDPTAPPFASPFGAAAVPVAPVMYVGRSEPIGAIVLIAVGVLFLLSTLGVFEWHWISRGWPVLIIVIGASLLVRRLRSAPAAIRPPVGGGL